MRTVTLMTDKFLVGKLLASGTVDGQFVELDLAPLYFDGMLPFDYYIGYLVEIEFKTIKSWKMHHEGKQHEAFIELKEAKIKRFMQ